MSLFSLSLVIVLADELPGEPASHEPLAPRRSLLLRPALRSLSLSLSLSLALLDIAQPARRLAKSDDCDCRYMNFGADK